MIPWAFVTVISIMLFSSGTACHRIHQPNGVITVAVGNTVTLQCFAKGDNLFWYKQIVGQKPRVITAFVKWSEPKFYNEFNNDRFSGKILGSNFNLTISDITQSDEAVYYCGAKVLYMEFGNGTHLIVKGQKNLTSKILTSDHLNDHMDCPQKCYENSTKQINNETFSVHIAEEISEEKLCPAVLGLACALGFCGVLVFALVGFICKRVRGSGQDNHGQSNAQDTDDENLTYAALRFSLNKRKSREKRELSQQTMRVCTSD
ncbi:uncharacterized protein [Pseudorasbora parva]|uniref:uncharacterized protein n=1 Tax=Pseudorasbora parva TaxID=51549 RepID=UPI00351E3BF4